MTMEIYLKAADSPLTEANVFETQPSRILCNATAEMLRFGSVPLWSIEVTGVHPHGWRRVYEIEAASDTIAAQEGIRRFVEEAEILADGWA